MAGDKRAGENPTVPRAKRTSRRASPSVDHNDHDTDGEERKEEPVVVENSSSGLGDESEHEIEGSEQPPHNFLSMSLLRLANLMEVKA